MPRVKSYIQHKHLRICVKELQTHGYWKQVKKYYAECDISVRSVLGSTVLAN